jgi:hypothetical protein
MHIDKSQVLIETSLLFKVQMFIAGRLGVATVELSDATTDFSRKIIQSRVDDTTKLLEEVTGALQADWTEKS